MAAPHRSAGEGACSDTTKAHQPRPQDSSADASNLVRCTCHAVDTGRGVVAG